MFKLVTCIYGLTNRKMLVLKVAFNIARCTQIMVIHTVDSKLTLCEDGMKRCMDLDICSKESIGT